MADLVKDVWAGMPWYLYLILIIAVGLLIASFIVPPLGVIAPSVLQAAALIIGGTWLLYTTANIPAFIAVGARVRASYGKAKIEIGDGNQRTEVNINENNPDE